MPKNFYGSFNITKDLSATKADVDNIQIDGNSIISTDAAGDVNITPDTTGDLVLDGLKWPQADGTTGYALKTDGAAQLSWTPVGIGDVVGPAGATDHALARFDTATGKLLQDSVGILTDAGALSGITLLDVDNVQINGNAVISTDTNGDLTLTPDGTGDLILDGLKWPQADGTAGYVLKTDGGAQLSWVVAGTGDVVGPAGATDHALARFDTATGKLLQDSVGVLTDAGAYPV